MLRIHLLGQLRLFFAERPHKFLTSSRTVPLLAYLLLHGHDPIQRNWLAYTLWPDNKESDARGSLRRFLHELRQLLPPNREGVPWILADTTTVQWNPAADVWVDVEAFDRLLSEPDKLADAVALYSGDLLPELYDDWIIAGRERLRNRFLDALFQLVQRARNARDLPATIGYAQTLLQHDPLREDAVRELMIARNGAGDRAGALQEYQRFDQRIRSELGVPPMLETSALYDAIAKQLTLPGPPGILGVSAAAASAFSSTTIASAAIVPVNGPHPAADALPLTNLPAQLTAFIGREREVATLQTLLGDERAAVRLLTLAGPGGSGKSRLAVEFAMRMRTQAPDRFGDGLFLVSLAGLRSAELVLPAIAETLKVPEVPGQALIESIKAYLRPRSLLLLLDNFEHLVDSAPVVVELLAAAPGLRVLVTSRAALRIYGEHEFQLQPLPVPAAGDLPSLADLARIGSVALFVARSRAVNPSFTLNHENGADVAQVCVKLDGLPLAIELAAARSKLLAPAAILARLEHRLSFLVARDRQAHDRHQTLRAALDWSYNLLPPAECALLRRLAVFAGSFTLDAAEALCDSADALAGVESLLDNSLLQPVQEDPDEIPPGMGEGVRLRMLATVRDYALERLAEAGEESEAHAKLTHVLIGVMEQSNISLRGGPQGPWLRYLELEHDTLRAALRWSLEQRRDPRAGMRLAAVSALYWLVAGHWREGIEWLQRALDENRDAPPELARLVFNGLGFLIMARGDLAPAVPYFEEGLRLNRLVGDQRGVADSLFGLGRILTRQRCFDEGDVLVRESLAIAQAQQYEWRISYAQIVLGMIALLRADLALAEEHTRIALDYSIRIQNKIGMAQMFTALGEIARTRGDYATAQAEYDQALVLAQELGQKARIMMVAHNLGHVSLFYGQTRRAAAYFKEALRLGQELPDKENFAMCLLGLGGVAAAEGNAQLAARLIGAGEGALHQLGVDLAPADQGDYERNRALALSLLDAESYDGLRSEGRLLSPAEAESLGYKV